MERFGRKSFSTAVLWVLLSATLVPAATTPLYPGDQTILVRHRRQPMRTVYTIYFLLAVSLLVGIVIAGVLQIYKERAAEVVPEVAVRSKRQLVQVLRNYGGFSGFGAPSPYGGFGGSAASANANAIGQGFGVFEGVSGANAASNALSQNIGGFGFGSSNANANAFSQQVGPGGFGSSAANAQAQSFQSDSPFGSFGASASNAASQGFSAGPGGLTGTAGFSGSQTYNLPGSRKISLAYSNGFSLGGDAPSLPFSWLAVIGVVMLLFGYVLTMPAEDNTGKERPLGGLAEAGNIHEEVVVGAQLYVRKKPATALRRQEREIRHDHVTHGTSHVNRLESPGKEQPHLGKHHHKVSPTWKNTKTAAKVNQHWDQFVAVIVLSALVIGALGQNDGRDAAVRDRAGSGYEVLVESSLHVRKANPAVRRNVRSVLDLLVPPEAALVRQKRQFGGFGASSAQANANAFNQQFGPNGFGASAANAGAQSFYNQGPGGGFGASAANSASQGFAVGPGGFSGSAGQSGSQSYKLPGNKDVSLSYSGGFSVANGQPSVSQGNSFSITKKHSGAMSVSTVVVFGLLCGVALSVAYPYPYPQNAFMYYRSAYPMMAFPQLQPTTMYQQAMFQNQRLRSYHRRSAGTSGVAAFAAGDNIATGTQILKDPAAAGYPSVQSFADAYPAEALPENELPEADDGGQLEPEANDGAGELDFPAEEPLEDVPAPLVPPSASDKRKKKVTVQLDSASDEDEQDEQEVSFGTRRGSGSRPSAPAGPMFPVTFGSTSGGAIAIANSYSTGKGGSATSHATAYGSPASTPEERRRAVILHQQQQQQQQQQRSIRPAKLRTKY
uniref:Transmembrane protein n=1 Tax=Anopheles dirus TaxID=7168 RepID=A0A182N9K3_9DIPT